MQLYGKPLEQKFSCRTIQKMTTLIDYEAHEFKSATDFLEKYPNTWLYQRFDGLAHSVTDYSMIKKDGAEYYLRINEFGNLEIYRPASAVKDVAWNPKAPLNPRLEIVPGIRLPKHKPLHVVYEVSPTQGGNTSMSAIVFQLVHHEPNGSTLPVFSIEMRYGVVRSRWNIIKADGTYSEFKVNTLGTLAMNKWYNFQIDVLFREDATGYIRVSVDGILLWSHDNAITCSVNPALPQLQFGIYGLEGLDERTQVRKLKVTQ